MTAEQIAEAAKKGTQEAMAALEARVAAIESKPVTANAKGIDNPANPAIPGIAGNTKAARVERMLKAHAARDVHKGAGIAAGAVLRALAHATKNHFREDVDVILAKWGYEQYAAEVKALKGDVGDMVLRTLGENSVTAGGILVVPEYASEIIELLRATSVIRSLNPTIVPMSRGNVTIRKQTGASTASYIGEATAGTPSTPATGSVSLVARKLLALIVASNELIADASPEADAMIRNDFIQVIGLREDLAFIRGDGALDTPKGMRTLANAANVVAATQAGGTATLAEVAADLQGMIGKLQDNNVLPDSSCFFLMSPRSKRFLMNLRDGVGKFVYMDELKARTLYGYKVVESTQIPNTLNGTAESGSTDSEVYFAKASELLLGDTKTLEITFHPDGSYYDGSVTRSGVSQDVSVFRAISRHDFNVRHDYAIARMHTVKWGA